jgi:hypothetical protein
MALICTLHCNEYGGECCSVAAVSLFVIGT